MLPFEWFGVFGFVCCGGLFWVVDTVGLMFVGLRGLDVYLAVLRGEWGWYNIG